MVMLVDTVLIMLNKSKLYNGSTSWVVKRIIEAVVDRLDRLIKLENTQ